MAKRRQIRLNRKLILTTLVLVLTGSVGIVVAHRVQVAATAERARGIGISASANKEWHEAVTHLRLYLQKDPHDTEVLAACAYALAEGYHELEEAIELYEQILKIDHYEHEARRQVVELSLKLGRTEAAVENARILADRYPGDAAVMFLAGRAAEADNRVIDAIRRYRVACRSDEFHVGANQRLAVLYKVVLGNDQASAASIERLEKSGDRSFETLRTFAEYQLTQGLVDEANEQLVQAIGVWDGRVQQVISASQIAIRISAYEAGKRDTRFASDLHRRLNAPLNTAIKNHPESVFFDMSLAQLQAYAGQREQSIETLQKAIDRVPENRELHFQLTWQLIESRQFYSATENIGRIRNSTYGAPESNNKHADLLVAVVTLQKGDIAEASKLLHNAVLQGIEPTAVAPIVGRLEASCYEQLANWEDAAEAWRRVLHLEPGNRLVRLSMAFSLAASDKYGDAIRMLNSIPRLGKVLANADRQSSENVDSESPNRLRPKFSLSNLLSKNNSPLSSRARSLFLAIQHASREEYLKAHQVLDSQKDVTERLLDVVALTSSSDSVDAAVLETIVTIDRGDARPVTAMLLSGSTDADRLQKLANERLAGLDSDKWLEAAGVLASGAAGAARSIRSSAPDRAEQLDAYAGSVLQRMVEYDRGVIPQIVEYQISAARFDKAIEWCRAGWPDFPERLASHWLAAARQHSSGREKLAELEAVLVQELNGPNDVQSGSPVATRDVNDEPTVQVKVGLALADLYLMTGRDSLAESAYLKVLESKPDHVTALNNTAWLMFIGQRQPTVAGGLIQRAIDVAGERSDLLDTRGCVNVALGNNQAAIDDFSNAIRLGAGPDAIFHLAIALQRTGDVETARKALAKARADGFKLAGVTAYERRLAMEIAD